MTARSLALILNGLLSSSFMAQNKWWRRVSTKTIIRVCFEKNSLRAFANRNENAAAFENVVVSSNIPRIPDYRPEKLDNMGVQNILSEQTLESTVNGLHISKVVPL